MAERRLFGGKGGVSQPSLRDRKPSKSSKAVFPGNTNKTNTIMFGTKGGVSQPSLRNPKPTKKAPSNFNMFPGSANKGNQIINKIYRAAGKSRTQRERREQNAAAPTPPPDIMTPGTGVAGGNLPKGAFGSNVKAGKRTRVDTSLNVDNSDVAKRAKNASAMEYNPQIDAIRNLIQSTKSEGQQGIQKTGQAYGALQNEIQGQLPGVNKSYDDSQAKIAELYKQLTGGIDQRYDATTDRNNAEFERLGIQQAAPQASAALTSDRDFLSSIAGLLGSGANNSLEIMQRSAASATQSNANRAGFEGVNRKTDMRGDLADKLLQLRSQKGELKGNKARSRRELTDQYQQESEAQAERDRAFGLDAAQFRESVKQDRRNFKYNRAQDASAGEINLAKLGLDQQGNQQKAVESARKAESDAAKQQATDFKNLDPQERAAYKAEQLTPGSGDKMFALLQSLMNSDKNIRRGMYLKTDKNNRTIQIKMTPEQFGYLAAKQAKKAGLPRGSVQKIATAYWMER